MEPPVTKSEYKPLSGKISDLAWDGESKRIIVVGEGRDKFGHSFTVDSGNSTGDIGGHSKVVNAVAIRHQRPFRAVTGSDDTTIVFHQGVPYKYDRVCIGGADGVGTHGFIDCRPLKRIRDLSKMYVIRQMEIYLPLSDQTPKVIIHFLSRPVLLRPL